MRNLLRLFMKVRVRGYRLSDDVFLVLFGFSYFVIAVLNGISLRIGKNLPKTREEYAARFLVKDLAIRTRYGMFRIRKRCEDFFIVNPAFEAEVMEVFRPEKEDLVVDCGAHIGKYTVYCGRACHRVIAIEPEPENFKLLCKNIELNRLSNVLALNCALWNEHRELPLHIQTKMHTAGYSLRGSGFKSVSVNCFRLDSIVSFYDIDRCDWIKIDVEGAEYEVLLGGVDTITKFKPRLIIEIFDENYKKCEGLLDDLDYELIPVLHGKGLSYYRCNPIQRKQ